MGSVAYVIRRGRCMDAQETSSLCYSAGAGVHGSRMGVPLAYEKVLPRRSTQPTSRIVLWLYDGSFPIIFGARSEGCPWFSRSTL